MARRRARPRWTRRSSRARELEVVPGAGRHDDPGLRAAAGQVRERSRARSSWRSTAGPRRRRCRASTSARRCSSTRASSSSSPTCAAATATARRGRTPTTGPSASRSSRTSRTRRSGRRQTFSSERQGAQGGRLRRQLRRLLGAHGDDHVRGRLRRGRGHRRHQRSAHLPAQHGALPAHPAHLASTAIRTRTPTRSRSCRP